MPAIFLKFSGKDSDIQIEGAIKAAYADHFQPCSTTKQSSALLFEIGAFFVGHVLSQVALLIV
jgi:hypothetical protein